MIPGSGQLSQEMTMSADDAIEMSRDKWVQMARAREAAGGEIPAGGISASIYGDFAREQVEVSRELVQATHRRSFTMSFSLAELIERAAARREAQEAQERAAQEAQKRGESA